MPKVVHALRAAQKSGAIDDVGFSFQDWFEEFAVVPGVVLEIGILHQDDIASGRLKTAAQRGSLTAVLGLKEEADIPDRQSGLAVLHQNIALTCRLRLFKIFQESARAVRGF